MHISVQFAKSSERFKMLFTLQNALVAIDMRDMEQLAEMVLNGDGQFLVGTKSDQPEIQAFLDNVPLYMVRMDELQLKL